MEPHGGRWGANSLRGALEASKSFKSRCALGLHGAQAVPHQGLHSLTCETESLDRSIAENSVPTHWFLMMYLQGQFWLVCRALRPYFVFLAFSQSASYYIKCSISSQCPTLVSSVLFPRRNWRLKALDLLGIVPLTCISLLLPGQQFKEHTGSTSEAHEAPEVWVRVARCVP